MAIFQCLNCGKWETAKTARKRTCSDRCRKAVSMKTKRERKKPLPAQGSRDTTDELLKAIENARANEDIGELGRLEKAIEPVSIDDVAMSPLELRQKYGATADLNTLLKLRGLTPYAALTQFLGES